MHNHRQPTVFFAPRKPSLPTLLIPRHCRPLDVGEQERLRHPFRHTYCQMSDLLMDVHEKSIAGPSSDLLDQANKDVSENSILDFHLAHRTNPDFAYEPNKDTPKLIWKYLSSSIVLPNVLFCKLQYLQ